MAAIGVIPKGMLPEVFLLQANCKTASDTIESNLKVVGEMIKANPQGVDLKVTITLLGKQVEILKAHQSQAEKLLERFGVSNQACSSCCADCCSCCDCTTTTVKKRLVTVLEPVTYITGIVSLGAGTFNDNCSKGGGPNPLQILAFCCLVAQGIFSKTKDYLAGVIAAQQMNVSKLSLLLEKTERVIESTNAVIEVYKRVDKYDGRPGGRKVKDELGGAIPEVFRELVPVDALQNYVQLKYNTLPPSSGKQASGDRMGLSSGSVRRNRPENRSRSRSSERLPADVRAPESGKLKPKAPDKSSTQPSTEPVGGPSAMLDALVLGSVKMVKAVTEKPAEENGTSAVFVPLSETPVQSEVPSQPKDPVLNDVKEKPVEQPVGVVPTSADNAISLTNPTRVVSEPIKVESKQELPAPPNTNSAVTIEMPSQPISSSPSTEGSNEGKEQPKAPESKPKRKGLWGYMGGDSA